MPYCINCGEQLQDNARFCSKCGTAVNISNEEQRKTVYEGSVHYCPQCRESINAFVSVCPSCGHEFRGTQSSRVIKELLLDIKNAKNNDEVVQLIKIFPISNNKEDIMEFMILASSNFNEKDYVLHTTEYNVSEAWLSKIEQCNKKAKLSLSQNDIIEINKMYTDVKDRISYTKNELSSSISSHKVALYVNEFKKGKFRKVLVVSTVISLLLCVIAFNNGKILSGIIAVIMSSAFVTSLLMGYGVIEEKKRHLHIVPAILAFILVIPYFSLNSIDSIDPSKENITRWDDILLNEYAPKPIMDSAKTMTNSKEKFYIYDIECARSEYYDYVESCKAFGYNYEITEENEYSFEAYNQDGYFINISYITTLTVELNSPIEMKSIVWPNSNIAKLLPQPKSLYGRVEWEYESGFLMYIGNITLTDYKEYVELVYNSGFNKDYKKGDTHFWANNKDGYHVSIQYEGFNIMFLRIDEPNE